MEGTEGTSRLVGWCLIGAACLDLVMAYVFAFVRPPPDARARVVLPLAMVAGALVVAGLGIAFLVGAIGG